MLGNLVDGQRNLERSWKVREKSGNLKINGYGRQSSENLFCSRRERMYILMRYLVQAHLPPHQGLLLKERICSFGEQIHSFNK